MALTQRLLQFHCIHSIMESEVLFTYFYICNQRLSALDFSLHINVHSVVQSFVLVIQGVQNVNPNPAR